MLVEFHCCDEAVIVAVDRLEGPQDLLREHVIRDLFTSRQLEIHPDTSGPGVMRFQVLRDLLADAFIAEGQQRRSPHNCPQLQGKGQTDY